MRGSLARWIFWRQTVQVLVKKKTRLQHSLRKKAVVQKPNDNQLKCGPLQHTPALSFKPHPNSATNLTKPSWPFVFQQHPVQWDAWSFLNAAPLKRQGVHFTFQKVTHISFSHCSETVQIIQVCILNNLNIYIYIIYIYMIYDDIFMYVYWYESVSIHQTIQFNWMSLKITSKGHTKNS